MKTITAIVIIIILAGVGFYAYQYTEGKNAAKEGDAGAAMTGGSQAANSKVKGINDVGSVKATDVGWKFENKAEDASGIPMTKVSVLIQQNTYTVGTYQGSCSIRDNATLQPNELGGALCWYAGAGDEIGVYKENGRLYIKHRQVDEGTAEADGQKGPFEVILTL